MRSKLLFAVAVLLGATAPGVHAQQNQFQVYASVVDGAGNPVAALEPADVRVMEGGVEAKVVKVEPVNWPIKVQLLLDNGIGLGNQNIQILKDGVKGLIEALPDNLEVTIVTTAPQPRFLVRPTTDKAMMIDGLSRLAPDSGAGRFVESMNEATQRIEKDKTDHFPVIISSATRSGDANVLERDVKRIFERIEKKPTTVHVILLNQAGSATGGANQTQVGLAVTQATRGRYENIAAAVDASSGDREAGGNQPREAESPVPPHHGAARWRQGGPWPDRSGRARRTLTQGDLARRTSAIRNSQTSNSQLPNFPSDASIGS